MAGIDLHRLIGKLNETCRVALDAAAGATASRRQFNVEIEHWLIELLAADTSDVSLIVRHLDRNKSRLVGELNAVLAQLDSGNGRGAVLAPDLLAVIRDAWAFASIDWDAPAIRSGHLLLAMLSDDGVSYRLRENCPQLGDLLADVVRRDFTQLTEGSVEAGETGSGRCERGGPPAAVLPFTTDLTAMARDGRIDPVLGRDDEIRQVIDILARRRQNNPILTGEAGVGKTAIVEGLALRIAAGDVPSTLADSTILVVDMGLLQAGAGRRGEFEERLRSVIDAAKAGAGRVILFIDEAHTLIGAGGAAGQNDAANLLKPALARGELRAIAATTWAEYRKHIEKDAALARRFQAVRVDEPGDEAAAEMLRGLVPLLETHHGVHILEEAVEAAVRLSRRYIADRQLPDKAISLVDTACARVAMSQTATPPMIEMHRRRLATIAAKRTLVDREARSHAGDAARLAVLAEEAAVIAKLLEQEEARWLDERRQVDVFLEARRRAERPEAGRMERDEAIAAEAGLRRLQGDAPLVFAEVDAQAVAHVVEAWTGIPAGRMRTSDAVQLRGLEDALRARIVGQDQAIRAITKVIQASRAGLNDPNKPVGVFLMAGMSGVGKSETAIALADCLYGGPQNLITINMTEFKEEHKVSLLMGSPPGYVGYGDGGVLTEAVRRRPHSVLLLDEIEKAHPSVQDVFFQVFDKGTLKDSEGRDVDFRNTVIIMTTNVGAELIASIDTGSDDVRDDASRSDLLRVEMLRHFKASFLGRSLLVPCGPLNVAMLRRIAEIQITGLETRLREQHGLRLRIADDLRDGLILKAIQAHSEQAGARSVHAAIEETLIAPVSDSIFTLITDSSWPSSIELTQAADGSIVVTPFFSLPANAGT